MDYDEKGLCIDLEGDEEAIDQYVSYVKSLESAAGTLYNGEIKELANRQFPHEGIEYFPISALEEYASDAQEGDESGDEADHESADEAHVPYGQSEYRTDPEDLESQPLLLPESELFSQPMEAANQVEEEGMDVEEADELSQSILSRRNRR